MMRQLKETDTLRFKGELIVNSACTQNPLVYRLSLQQNLSNDTRGSEAFLILARTSRNLDGSWCAIHNICLVCEKMSMKRFLSVFVILQVLVAPFGHKSSVSTFLSALR